MVVSFLFPRITFLLLIIAVNNTLPLAVQAKTPTAKSLLWEISGNGLKHPSYLFGTMHVGCASRLALTTEQQKSLSKVQQIYFEIDKGISITVSDPKIPEGKKLKDLIPLSQYQKIEDFFGHYVLEKPFNTGIFSLISRVSHINKVGRIRSALCKDITSKELVLEEAAKKQKILINGIETEADRRDIFSIKDSVDLLVGVISDDTPQELLDKNIISTDVLYHNQDINGLFIHDQKFSKKYSGVSDALLVNRNRLWLPRMIKAMSKKPTFFAFGVGHLTSETGLIPLLERRGYTLRPIFDKNVVTPAKLTITESSKIMELAEEYLRAGDAKSLEGNVLDAHDDYSQAITLNPQYVDAYYGRGKLRSDILRDPKGALSDFNTAININPKYMPLYLNRGLLKSHKLKDYAGAVLDFDKVISLDSGVYRAYYERSIIKSEHLNDLQGALLDFNTAIYYSHRNQELYLTRGILKYTKLNDKLGGIDDVRKSIKLAQKSDDNLTIEKASAVLKMMGTSEK